MAAATRRASARSSSVQQLPNPSPGAPSRWSYSCIDTPIVSTPLERNERGGDRRIHAARHGDDDAHWASRRMRHAPTVARVSARSFCTRPGSTLTTRSISASVLAAPRLKRNELCARAEPRPIAFSTCEGSSVPDEQADPVETAMPSKSSAISSDSASTRSKLMFVVFGHALVSARRSRPCAARRAGCPPRGDRAGRQSARPMTVERLHRQPRGYAHARRAQEHFLCRRGDCAPAGRPSSAA